MPEPIFAPCREAAASALLGALRAWLHVRPARDRSTMKLREWVVKYFNIIGP
jgi:hypothetical protein